MPFEGARLLDELRPAELASFLWHAIRAVQLWVACPIEQRRSLFGGSPRGNMDYVSKLPASCAEAIRTLVLLIERPEAVQADAVSGACRTISTWAADEGFLNTESEFADAVAYALPEDADAALFAGRAARRSGASERAQAWYRRASGLARRHRDKPAFVLSLIRRGTLAEERGDIASAKSMQTRAWKAARRYKLDKLGAYAQHELLVIAVHSGSLAEGQQHAGTALRLYGRFDERFPQLAHDTAFLWAWHGYHGAALPVYEAVLPFLTRIGERVQVVANIGRAAAATGDADRFFRAWQEVEGRGHDAREHAATAFLNLALAANTLGLKTQATELARRGRQRADSDGQRILREKLDQLLRDIPMGTAKDENLPATPEMVGLAATMLNRLRRASASPK